jgi:CubicO group peptidase (beta-lactamase class C family)
VLSRWIETGKLPCASIIVAQNGAVIHRGCIGFSDLENRTALPSDAIFRIYSMSKPVTAAALMHIAEQGHIVLSDHVAKYVPEFSSLRVYRTDGATEPAQPMTIEHLLTHTSGLSYSFYPNSPVSRLYVSAGLDAGTWSQSTEVLGLDDMARRLATVPLVCQPGARWHYGMSFDVAGLIIERVSGQSLPAFMAANLFTPLGMSDTGFFTEHADRLAALYGPSLAGLRRLDRSGNITFDRPPRAASGGGGLVSTTSDYFRFAQMLVNGGTLDGQRVLSEESVALMTRNHLQPDQCAELPIVARFGYGGNGAGLGFGFGGAVVTDVAQTHAPGSVGEYGWGGAASTTFWTDRARNVSVVFMTQLLPSGTVDIRDALKSAVYQAL